MEGGVRGAKSNARRSVKTKNLTNWDPFYAVDAGIVCALSYAIAGLKLGEAVAIGLPAADTNRTCSGRFDGFVLDRTGGSRIKISKESLTTL